MVDELCEESMEHVFGAFGLLVDNSLIFGAKEVRVYFNFINKERYCMIEDNGSCSKIWDHNRHFIEDMVRFRTYIELNIDQLEPYHEEQTKRNTFHEETVKEKEIKEISKELKEQQ